MAGLVEVFTTAFEKVVAWVTTGFQTGLETGYDVISASLFGTPTPVTSGVFVLGPPTNEPWSSLHESLVVGEVTLFSLLILVVCVQARHTIAAAGFASRIRASRTRRSAWTGGFLIVTWYWLAAIGLYLVDAFALALLPNLETVLGSLSSYLAISMLNPVLGLSFALIGGGSMWLLQAFFFARKIVLPITVYAMPVALAVAYGGIPIVSRIAFAFALRFVPLAIAPIPAALVLRGYELAVTSGFLTLSNAFTQTVLVVSLPVVLILVTWRVFRYSNPRTTGLVRGVTRGAAVLGVAGAGATVAGPAVGVTAARIGPKAAAGHAVLDSIGRRGQRDESPSYRRTERDPLAEER